MRIIRNLIVLTLLALVIFYFMERSETSPKEVVSNVPKLFENKSNEMEEKISPEHTAPSIQLKGEVLGWIGKEQQDLIKEIGDPSRVDPSAYGYEWFVYHDSPSHYLQFGIEDKEIKMIYAAGSGLETDLLYVGQPYEEIRKTYSFDNEVTYSEGISSYTFRLTDEDLKMRPLVKLDENTFIQFYFDTFTDELSSVRVLTADTLLKHRPYEIEYRGELPEESNLTDKEWAEVERGMEQQVFDITNVMRHQHGLDKLEWEKSVHEVAYRHSRDMAENNYFSHYSQNGDGLKERLQAEEVFYTAAGENIAAQYPDAPAAMLGWLNSQGHREALLNEDYTHIGVGVYRFYYTQNFLGKPV